MNKRIILALILSSSIIGCATRLVQQQSSNTSINEEFSPTDPFKWENLTPIEFLNYLKERQGTLLTIWEPAPRDWIKKEHIPKLMELIESNTPCAHTVAAISSCLPPPKSTIGDEAIFLIDGFIEGRYPPGLYSKGKSKQKIESIKEWYEEWKINKKL